MNSPSSSLLAIDVGSSRIKLGWFPGTEGCTSEKSAGNLPIAAPPLPAPAEQFQVQHQERPPDVWLAEIHDWLDGLPLESVGRCLVASVHAAAADALIDALDRRSVRRCVTLAAGDLPLVVRLPEPQRVGIDRLLGAVAANQLRSPGAPAISVSLGTAITVNLIAPDGAFAGGAILAGQQLGLTALHHDTASLPFLDVSMLAVPGSPCGTNTIEAMASGVHWGTIGAVRELITRMAGLHERPPEVFLTGGGASNVLANELRTPDLAVRHVPHLVLAGIALTAQAMAAR
jgi:type III pantothenate kinase